MSVYSEDGMDYPQGKMDTYNFPFLSSQGYWFKPPELKNVETTAEYLLNSNKGNA